jgi:hypothetical protein
MALHQVIQSLLLIGAKLPAVPTGSPPPPPLRLRALNEALAARHRGFDAEAVRFGHRYRSGFWAIYLLSALAVLCAMMPLALGWDALDSYAHSWAAAWVIAEILVIAGVALIYWRGHRSDWQGSWLRARTTAELTGWLPLVAPLAVDDDGPPSWYARAGLTGPYFTAPDEVTNLCRMNETPVREALAGAWSDPRFLDEYARWLAGTLSVQQAYHARVARRAHLLRHRIHRITTALFIVTGLAAVAHLFLHTRWISLITTVFPAGAAALHGALAQSEAFRLEAASERMSLEMRLAADAIQATSSEASLAERASKLRRLAGGAVATLLQEHQDWHMLVRPHHLPLG